MKKHKRLIAAIFTFIIVFSLMACSAKESNSDLNPVQAVQPETSEPESLPTNISEPNQAVEKVTYYCTVGAYLDVLTEAVTDWNNSTGAEKGVYIEITSNINDGTSANEILMQAGTYHDITNGTSNQSWVLNGWVKDLYEVAETDEELASMIEASKQYFVPGLEEVNGILTALPLEVVPIKLAVNTDLLNKYGYDIPATIDEMVETAIGIYEQSGGEAFGWGGSTWSAMCRRILMKAVVNSTGTLHWDTNTGTYDFSPFKKIIEAYAEMYQSGAVLGLDDLGIDPVRAEFASGKIAFFTAPSYDIAVYTSQFPAECNWTIIDFPTYEDGDAPYKGIYLDRVNMGICAPAYDNATETHQKAIVEAFKFLNSDELYSKIYANAGIIPYQQDIINNTDLEVDIPQWALMSDISNYTSMPLYPDSVIPLEGDNYDTVFREVIRGNLSFDEAVEDLNARYNAAAQAAIDDPDINMDMYIYAWSAEK